MSLRQTASKWIVTVVAIVVGAVFVLAYQPDIPYAELRARYADETSRFIDVLGMPVHYRDEGDGPALVLLHGTGSSLHTWQGWVDTLGNDFRIIRLDLPGFGLTGPDPSGDYSIERYVEFLHRYSAALGIDRFHLAGNSLGGEIAWRYAIEYPEKVDRLVLIAAAGFPRDEAPNPSLAFRLGRLPVVGEITTQLLRRSLVENSLLEVYADDSKVSDELVDRHFELALRPGNRAAFVARVRQAVRESPGDPRDVGRPTLIQWGMADRWIPVSDGQAFKLAIPDARLLVYPDVGHVPMEELPGPTARAASAFLRGGRRP